MINGFQSEWSLGNIVMRCLTMACYVTLFWIFAFAYWLLAKDIEARNKNEIFRKTPWVYLKNSVLIIILILAIGVGLVCGKNRNLELI